MSNSKKKIWDQQYADGAWDVLRSPVEEERFEAVRNFIYKYANNGKILEVGCGEGLLQAKMNKHSYSRFVGIDLSSVAIKKAAYLKDKTTAYLCADMERYKPRSPFGIIIFNESLYYASKPVLLMARYMEFLVPGGIMILSIYETTSSRQLLYDIATLYTHIDEKITENSRGRWYCRVYSSKTI